jgi:hypothetical protein
MMPNLCRIEREGQPDPSGIFFKPPPVAFERESLAPKNPRGRKQAPAVQKSSLARRKARLLNGHYPVIVEDMPINQVDLILLRFMRRRLPRCAVIF